MDIETELKEFYDIWIPVTYGLTDDPDWYNFGGRWEVICLSLPKV